MQTLAGRPLRDSEKKVTLRDDAGQVIPFTENGDEEAKANTRIYIHTTWAQQRASKVARESGRAGKPGTAPPLGREGGAREEGGFHSPFGTCSECLQGE